MSEKNRKFFTGNQKAKVALEAIKNQRTLNEIEAQQGSEFLQKVYHWISQQPDMTGSVAV